MWQLFEFRLWMFIVFLGVASIVESAKIFAIFSYQSPSHYICIKPIIHELVRKGHELTVASGIKEENMTSNYRHIQIDKKTLMDILIQETLPPGAKLQLNQVILTTAFDLIASLQDAAVMSTDLYLNSTELREFTVNSKENFDLVLTELFFNDAFYAYAHHFDAPLVLVSTFGNSAANNVYMGNPVTLSQTAHEYFNDVGNLNLFQRFKNILIMLYDMARRHIQYYPLINKGVRKYFSHSKKPMPNIEDISRNISLTLINTHFSLGDVRAQVPGIIEVGGMHIGKTEKLPEDIQIFLDEAVDGAVYLSLGTTLDLDDKMAFEEMTKILQVFAKFKQRFLVKYNNIATNVTSNIILRNWLPQAEILAHPNTKAFITHAGLLSSEEAVYFGVPTLAIPVFGDQRRNANLAVLRGSGLFIELQDLEEDNFSNALKELLENPKYRLKSLEISRAFRDRPLSALDTAIYWIEYVIRHKGAAHIKADLRNTAWFKEYNLDIIFLSIAILSACIFALYTLCVVIKKIIVLLFLQRQSQCVKRKKA